MFFKNKNTIVNNLLMICMHISIVKKKKKLYIQYFEVEGFKY